MGIVVAHADIPLPGGQAVEHGKLGRTRGSWRQCGRQCDCKSDTDRGSNPLDAGNTPIPHFENTLSFDGFTHP